MNWRPIRGWTKPLHERGMKAGSMPQRLLIGPGSPPSIDPVHPELSPPPEPCRQIIKNSVEQGHGTQSNPLGMKDLWPSASRFWKNQARVKNGQKLRS